MKEECHCCEMKPGGVIKTKDMKTCVSCGKPLPFPLPQYGFEEWVEEIKDEIETVSTLLSEKMSDNPVKLYTQLVQAEAWNARISTLLAHSNSFVDLAESRALHEVTGIGTDLDRKVGMRAKVVHERRVRDILAGLGESIKSRTILGMSLRKQNSGEKQL